MGSVQTDLDVIWLETDPRPIQHESGDGLPDGWKKQYGLDPFDDGVIGHYNLAHRQADHQCTNNGPNGDPDGDGCDEFAGVYQRL